MRTLLPTAALSLCAVAMSHGADWTNNGGDAGRNGQTADRGPDTATSVIWAMGRSSIIAWQPVTLGDRIFVVRQSGFPPEPNSDKSPVVCMDLNTGAELWAKNITAAATDWTTWIAGVSNDQVYAARSGNGASVSAKIHALDVTDGHEKWQSAASVNAGAYDGVVFAPDGDLIVGDFNQVIRINADNGATVWTTPRLCSVSSSCGVALHGNAVYTAEPVVGGHVIARYDLATGIRQYQSPLMVGFTLQNSPMVGPDGTIYLSRTQNNVTTDFFYAFTDTGSAIVNKWNLACGWSTVSEFAVGPDGSVYMLGTDYQVKRLDPTTGAIMNSSTGATSGSYAPRMAVDSGGRLFYSNGAFPTTTIYSYNSDLSLRWSVTAPSVNIGAPVIGEDGTLLIASTTRLTAYRTARPPCAGDLNGDFVVDLSDLGIVLSAYGCAGPGCGPADTNGDMAVDLSDLGVVLSAYGIPCP